MLKRDATLAGQQIDYPADLKLLNEGREQLERIIPERCQGGDLPMPRMHRQVAGQDSLELAKKRNKSSQAIGKGINKQLQYVKRDLGHVGKLMPKHKGLRGILDRRE